MQIECDDNGNYRFRLQGYVYEVGGIQTEEHLRQAIAYIHEKHPGRTVTTPQIIPAYNHHPAGNRKSRRTADSRARRQA